MASCKGGICHLGLWSQWLLSTKQEPFCEQFGWQGVEARGESCSKQHCSGHNSLSLGSSASVSIRQQGLIHWAGKALLWTFWYVSWNQCPSLPQTTSKLFLGKVPLCFCPSDEKSHRSDWLSYVGSEFYYRCSWNSEQVSEYLGPAITLSIWDTPLPSLAGVYEGRQSLVEEEGQQEQSWDREAVCCSGQHWEDAILKWDLIERLFPELLQWLKLSRTSFQYNVSPGDNIKLCISFCPSSSAFCSSSPILVKLRNHRKLLPWGQLDTFCKVCCIPLCRSATEMSAVTSATTLPDVLNMTKMRK